MKTTKIILTMICLAALLAVSGCGQKTEVLSLGPDGYGKITLPNGVTVLVNRDETTSLTSARILIGGGVLTETVADNGITNLMTKMLLKGNDSLSADQITERLDFLGASVSADCYRDYSAITVTSLTENFDEVLTIISRSLLSPTFPEEELTRLKQEMEGAIKASNDNQTQASGKLFWKTAYGDQGYGLPLLGTMESIGGITADNLKSHFQKFVGGKNLIFSIATDLPAERIGDLAQQRLGAIKPEAETIAPPALALQAEKTGFISFDRNQSFIFMGYTLSHLAPAEVPCLALLNELMGKNVGSRLWPLRQVEKLAYAVYSLYSLDKYDAVFQAAIGTDTSKVQQALASLNREWDRLVKDGVAEGELADAKVSLKNTMIFSIDRKAARAGNMAYYEYIGYGYRYPLELMAAGDRIGVNEMNDFIKRKLTDDRKYLSIVGKQ
ncbi:MAG: pitrilysin family protein [candidate division Zixibacteria bacterium]|nr:pitrilysin family protein [candidate division Zixibacteria bacterium]